MPKKNNFVAPDLYVNYVSDDEQVRKIFNDIEDVSNFFWEKHRQFEINRRYYKGEHYTPYEIEVIKSQYRQPIVLNEIQVKVEHLMGSQIQTRLDAKCSPREYADEANAQILNHILKWAEQINDITQIESQVFFNMLVDGIGCSIVRWKFEDLEFGYPSVEIIPAEELVFDTNAIYPDLRDARWMARIPLVTITDVAELFPDKYDIIEKYADNPFVSPMYKIPTLVNRKLASVRNDERKYVPFIEYFEVVKVFKYVVFDDIADKKYVFDDKNKAKDFLKGLIEQYTQGLTPVISPSGKKMLYSRKIIESCVEHTIVVGDKILHRELTALPEIPIQVCFAFWKDGDFWSYVEPMIPVQKMINNLMATYDHILGSSAKNPTLVTIPFLDKNMSFEQIRNELSKPRPIIPVNNPNAINTISDPPVNPQLFNFVGYLNNWLNEKAGGKNFLGYQENAAESGRAVLARAEQGGLIRLGMFDRLKYWRRDVAYMLVWFSKYFMPIGQTIRVLGLDDFSQLYLQLSEDVLENIREIKYDIVIDETYRSETMKERYFQQIKEMAAVTPYPPEVIMPLLIRFSNLPKTTQDELMNSLQFYKEYQMKLEKMQHEQKLQQQAEDSAKRKMLREAIIREQKLDEAAQKLQQKTKEVKTQLNEIEKLQQSIQENPSVATVSDKINTREEMQGIMGRINQEKLM